TYPPLFPYTTLFRFISRRAPVASRNRPLDPATVPPPRAARNWLTTGRMSAGVAPDAVNVVNVIGWAATRARPNGASGTHASIRRSEEHTSELQSRGQ